MGATEYYSNKQVRLALRLHSGDYMYFVVFVRHNHDRQQLFPGIKKSNVEKRYAIFIRGQKKRCDSDDPPRHSTNHYHSVSEGHREVALDE